MAVEERLDGIEFVAVRIVEHAEAESLRHRRTIAVEHRAAAAEIVPARLRRRIQPRPRLHDGGAGQAFGAFEPACEVEIGVRIGMGHATRSQSMGA
jgi:hypothetical protein